MYQTDFGLKSHTCYVFSNLFQIKGARMKLLQFHRNYRPAFYGTFRRKVKINGRRPYHKDTDCFNYEFDSGNFLFG